MWLGVTPGVARLATLGLPAARDIRCTHACLCACVQVAEEQQRYTVLKEAVDAATVGGGAAGGGAGRERGAGGMGWVACFQAHRRMTRRCVPLSHAPAWRGPRQVRYGIGRGQGAEHPSVAVAMAVAGRPVGVYMYTACAVVYVLAGLPGAAGHHARSPTSSTSCCDPTRRLADHPTMRCCGRQPYACVPCWPQPACRARRSRCRTLSRPRLRRASVCRRCECRRGRRAAWLTCCCCGVPHYVSMHAGAAITPFRLLRSYAATRLRCGASAHGRLPV